MSEDLDTLAKRFKFARAKRGIGSRALGRLAEVSESYPSLIESGMRERIEAGTMASLARVLGVSVEWLLMGGDEPEIEPYKPSEEAAPESANTFPPGADRVA